jgi:CheY-like chemotaxis protein
MIGRASDVCPASGKVSGVPSAVLELKLAGTAWHYDYLPIGSRHARSQARLWPTRWGNALCKGFAGSRDAARGGNLHGLHMALRCLIVDDSQAFLAAARGLLERQGVSVVGIASTSAEALERARELAPDVVLLDIDLGGESGLELARRLHADSRLASLPVILISTHPREDYADLIAASPALGFLPKIALSADAVRGMLDGSAVTGDVRISPQGGSAAENGGSRPKEPEARGEQLR